MAKPANSLKKPVLQKPATKELAPKKTAPKKTAPKKTATKTLVAKKAAPAAPSSKRTASKPKLAEPARQAFAGFGPEALAFLEGLAENNNRDWFQAHKDTYETHLRAPMGACVEALAFAFAAHDIPLTGDAKSSLFRVNRDVRFSKNKNPYKTNVGAVLSRDGGKGAKGVLYLQIAAGGDHFMAAGFYGPEPDDLARFREAIAAAPDKWTKVEEAMKKARLAFRRTDTLVRMPKGFDDFADSDIADALKLKSFVVTAKLSGADVSSPNMVGKVLKFATAAMPLLQFGWTALRA